MAIHFAKIVRGLMVAGSCILASCANTDLRLPGTAIEERLKVMTPLGTPHTVVVAELQNKKYKVAQIVHAHVSPLSSYPPTSLDGEGFIRVELGEYRTIFITSVEAFFIFDLGDNLIDVKVRKTTDAP